VANISPDHYRKLGNTLQAAGLLKMSVRAFEKSLQMSSEPNFQKAKVAYSLGELFENSGNLEESLNWYYQVELFDPNSSVTKSAQKKVVSLLERLGKSHAAKQALSEATSLEKEEDKNKGQVLARVGQRQIYIHDLNEALDTLPEQLRKQAEGRQGKLAILQKLVAEEILSQKAKRLSLHEKPSHRRQMEQLERQLLASQVIKEEIGKNIKVDPSDLKNYFEANQERYNLPERVRASLIEVKEKSLANTLRKKIKDAASFAKLAKEHSLDSSSKASGGEIAGYILKDRPFQGFSKEIANKVVSTKTQSVSKPLIHKGKYLLFFVHEKLAPLNPKYEEIQKQVESDYTMEKSQNLYSQLLSEAMKGDEVKIFEERVK
jgi:parvulin-like peptidyl-prolyl isomerase